MAHIHTRTCRHVTCPQHTPPQPVRPEGVLAATSPSAWPHAEPGEGRSTSDATKNVENVRDIQPLCLCGWDTTHNRGEGSIKQELFADTHAVLLQGIHRPSITTQYNSTACLNTHRQAGTH